jgi:hypothetical protein
MDAWVWAVLVAVIVILAIALFAWYRGRQRSGTIRAVKRSRGSG